MDCTERYETRGQAEYTLFAQPGMRFAISKALDHSLMQDEYFASRPESDKTHIAEKILEDVKRSDKIVYQQARHLRDETKLALISHRFDEVKGRFVIYRGETQTVGDIEYVNVEEYLNALGK